MTMKVVKIGDFNDVERRKQEDRIFILEQMIEKVQAGEIHEFVIAATSNEGDIEVSMYCEDFLGAIGMLEIGKHILVTTEAAGD